ncbi:MAG: PilX N-terminal [Pseudomonadota bacterium]|jgi:hypothetical protein
MDWNNQQRERRMKHLTTARFIAQRGAVLLMSLIFLIILSLLGVTAMNGTMIETKLAANYVEKNYALQITEAGLTQLGGMLNDDTKQGTLTSGGSVPGDAFSVGRGNNLTACVSNVRAEGKGSFPPARGSGDGTRIEIAYFEISALGTAAVDNGCSDTASGRVQTHLRSGVRQKKAKASQ